MSDSNSQQQQVSNFTDNRTVLGQGSTYTGAGGTSTITTTYNALDGGAISAAGSIASDALGLAGQVVDANANNVSQSYNFAGDAFQGALDTVNKTVAASLNASSDALAGALSSNNQTFTKSLDFADGAFNKVLDYSTHNTDQALSNLQYTQQLTANAYNDAKGRGALTDKIIIGALVVVGLVAIAAVHKGHA